ncbi:MAG TPA: hypothetical protein VN280_22570 [Variovorax sp.]|nr:hypothetical protein [Variovorax sp.]
MAASAGSLVVSLGLDAAEYTRGLTRAEYQARQFGEKIGSAIRSGAQLAVASLATIGTSAAASFAIFDSLVKSAGDFQDLAEKTGASAEALAGFAVSAAVGGANMDTVAAASIRLTKGLTGVDDESKAAGAAIGSLGLKLSDFKKLAPEEQIEAVSKALGGFAEGSGKTAVAVALFGKAGADLLPFLKALYEAGGRQNILTAEQIRLADDYADRQAKSRAELTLHAQAIATQFIPALTAVQNAVREVIGELISANGAQKDFALNLVILDWAEKVTLALATVGETAVGLAKTLRAVGGSFESVYADSKLLSALTPTGAIKAAISGDTIPKLLAERNAKAKEANDRYVDLWNYDGAKATTAIKKAFAEQRAVIKGAADPETQRLLARSRAAQGGLPTLNFQGATPKGGGGGKDDPTNKILDNQLKALENAAKEEEDILRSRNKMLDLYNGENLISTQAYFEGKRAAQDAAVSSQIALYDQEIAALQKYQAAAGKQTDRESAQGKINDLIEKKNRLTREAGETAIEWGFKERKALEDLAKQMNSVNAEVLELTGNLSEATRIRLGDQFGDLTKRLTANGDTAGLSQVERLKQLKQAQGDYGQQAESVSRITEGLRIEEERITLARQLGTTGELESLAKLGESRKAAVSQMQAMVAAQEAIARASGNPALVQNAERARLELEKLAAIADPLADKFNTLFADAAGSAFSDFINGTKTAKEAFKSFTDTIFKELTNLIVKDLFKQLFSGGGSGTGGFGFDFGSLLSGLFGSGRASGGSVAPFGMHRVNENGPELLDVNGKQYLMNGSRSARITPNNKLGGGMNYSPTFILDQPASRATQEQLSAVAYRGARRAMERTS